MKSGQFAIIGLGRFGSSLARELTKLGYDVLGIDKDEDVIQEMSQVITLAVIAESTDEDFLRSIGIRNFDCCIIAIGDDIQASILTALLLKELGVKQVIAKALTELHGRVLGKIGVDRIIYPERDMGVRVAHQLASPNLLDFIELSKDYTIAEIAVPNRLAGMSLKELDLRARFGCSIVAIQRDAGIVIAPDAGEALHARDVMILIGTKDQVEQFEASDIR